MQIDNALLQRLEKLSHLKVADDKREEIIGQLSEIVSFVDNRLLGVIKIVILITRIMP